MDRIKSKMISWQNPRYRCCYCFLAKTPILGHWYLLDWIQPYHYLSTWWNLRRSKVHFERIPWFYPVRTYQQRLFKWDFSTQNSTTVWISLRTIYRLGVDTGSQILQGVRNWRHGQGTVWCSGWTCRVDLWSEINPQNSSIYFGGTTNPHCSDHSDFGSINRPLSARKTSLRWRLQRKT